jgi:hypothetical protein
VRTQTSSSLEPVVRSVDTGSGIPLTERFADTRLGPRRSTTARHAGCCRTILDCKTV